MQGRQGKWGSLGGLPGKQFIKDPCTQFLDETRERVEIMGSNPSTIQASADKIRGSAYLREGDHPPPIPWLSSGGMWKSTKPN